MKTLLETTARATDLRHLELDAPLASLPSEKVKVIVQVESMNGAAEPLAGARVEQETLEEFTERIRRLNEAFPCPLPSRTTAEWMKELREGEER